MVIWCYLLHNIAVFLFVILSLIIVDKFSQKCIYDTLKPLFSLAKGFLTCCRCVVSTTKHDNKRQDSIGGYSTERD